MYIPKIKVEISDIEYNICSIAELLYSDFTNKSLPFKERIYKAFPSISKVIKQGMTDKEVYHAVKSILCEEYRKHMDEMEARKSELQGELESLLYKMLPPLFDLFEVEWPEATEYITCYLGLYAVFPRDVITKEYWIHYKTREEAVIRATMHEVNHFVLFEKWKSMHGYTLNEQPSHPDALWFLEEMAIDPTLNNQEIQDVVPYPQKAYDSFYTNTLKGIPIEDYIIKFFKERKSMADFLDISYKFILENYDVIRNKCG